VLTVVTNDVGNRGKVKCGVVLKRAQKQKRKKKKENKNTMPRGTGRAESQKYNSQENADDEKDMTKLCDSSTG